MVETMKMVCKICKAEHTKYQDGYYGGGKDKRWRSEDGKLFNGKLCPKCHRESARVSMQSYRDSRLAKES